MKRLSRINRIEFRNDFVLINGIPLDIDTDIAKWLEEGCEIKYNIESYIERFPENKKISFPEVNGIRIYLKNREIKEISISSYIPNDSRNRFEGEIIVFDKVLPKPFLSDDIENYFPNIEIEKPPKGYWKRFKSWESVTYPLNESCEIEISMSRMSEYVGVISLTRK